MTLGKDNKIDLVYLWVDGNDKNWLEKKNKYLSESNEKNLDKDSLDECRFIDNEELRYSLRSVEKYASWINRIFVVVDNQVPKFLNLKNEKIRIVNHCEILPKDVLPVFNSCAIETAIANIKELSEYFIYANDDMFFWDKTEPELFFKDEKPIYYLGDKIKKLKKYKHLYGYTISSAYKLAKERLKVDIPYFSHHNIDPYRKSLFIDCIKEFKDEFNKTQTNRFREFCDIQRIIITYYSYYRNCAVLKKTKLNFLEKLIKKEYSCDTQYFCLREKNLSKIKTAKAKILCVNDTIKATNDDRVKLREILNEKFSEKSSFEL